MVTIALDTALEILRSEPVTLLKLGGDPNVWRELFPRARIHALDVGPGLVEGVHVHRGSRYNWRALKSVHSIAGDFHLVVADDSLTAVDLVWPYLKPGGLYCRQSPQGVKVVARRGLEEDDD